MSLLSSPQGQELCEVKVVSTNHTYRIFSLEFEGLYPKRIYLQIIENTFLYSISSTKLRMFFEFATTLRIQPYFTDKGLKLFTFLHLCKFQLLQMKHWLKNVIYFPRSLIKQ